MSQDHLRIETVTFCSTRQCARVVQWLADRCVEVVPLGEEAAVVLERDEYEHGPLLSPNRQNTWFLGSLVEAREATPRPEEVLREFVDDIESVGTAEVLEDGWTDLLYTYVRAKAALTAIEG